MTTLKNLLWGALLALIFLPTSGTFAQEAPKYLVVTTMHIDHSYDEGSREEWLALENAYHDNVVMKNEYIMGATTLVHYYTDDNSEIKRVRAYKTWADIEKAQDRSEELENSAWGSKDAFMEFDSKIGSYYLPAHSDEIYHVLPGAKPLPPDVKDEMIYVVQVQEMAWPDDGTEEEIRELRTTYLENVIHQDPHLKAFYNERHGWGANSTDFIEVSVYSSWADIAKSNEEMEALIEQAWPDEKERDAFFDKYDRYYTGKHKDYIYRSVPSLRK